MHELLLLLAVEGADMAIAELDVLDERDEPREAEHRTNVFPAERPSVEAREQLAQA